MTLQVVSFFALALPGGGLALIGGCSEPDGSEHSAESLNMLLILGLALLAAAVIISNAT